MKWCLSPLQIVAISGALILLMVAIEYPSYSIRGDKVAAISCVLPSSHVLNFDKVRRVIKKNDSEIYFELTDGQRISITGNYTCAIREAP